MKWPNVLRGAAALPEPASGRWSHLLGRVAGRDRLVLDAGPGGVSAEVLRRQGPADRPTWVHAARAHSPLTDPGLALPALLAQLTQQGVTPPRRVALALAGAVIAPVDLPVDPAKPLSPGQMLEMVRYEAEPAIAAHNGLWTVGEVLSARGALDAAARADIAAAAQGGRVNEFGDPMRFGEVGVDMSRLRRDRLDEALAAQQTLQLLDNDVACGWRGQLVRDGQGHRLPQWRVAAMSGEQRAAWLAAARAARLGVLGFWPRLGLAAARASSSAGVCLVLEVWPEQVLALRLVDGMPGGLRTDPRREQPVDEHHLAELLLEWQVEPITEVVLIVADPDVVAGPLAQALQRLVRAEVRVLADGPDVALALRSAALATETTAVDEAAHSVRIALADPRPPTWKQPALRPWLAGAAVLLAMMAWQAHAWWGIHEMQVQRDGLDSKLSTRNAAQQQALSLGAEVQELDKEATRLRGELATALARAQGLSALSDRIDTLPALIRALGSAVDAQVVLDGVRESNDRDARIGIEVRAWSTEAARLQAYAGRVQQAVLGLGLSVAQSDVRARQGRLRTPGYQISFWLVPDAAELVLDPAPAEVPAVAPAASFSSRPGGRT